MGYLLPLAAQTPDTTVRQYSLTEVVVQGAEASAARVATVQQIGVADLIQLSPATAADVVRLVPGAHLQVNSRGEALIYLRGAAERQVALFLDGVPLNVPWDARFDLGLLPASAIGAIEVTKGPFSVLYGPNTAGGVVEIRTKSLSSPGQLVEAAAAGGLPARAEVGVSVHRHTSSALLDLSVAAGVRTADALPRTAHVPFSQSGTRLRTNTDRAQMGMVVRSARTLARGREVALTAAYLSANKGIAPESHLDPDTDLVRYWRYPVLRMGLVALMGEQRLGNDSFARGHAWVQHYAQHIDQYPTAAYDEPEAFQLDGDYTAGLRIAVQAEAVATIIRTSATVLTSLHRQVDAEAGVAAPLQRYRQHVAGAALDITQPIGQQWTVQTGAALEGLATPLTGDKPGRKSQVAWSGAAGVAWHPTAAWTVRAGAARKVRFPTLRELFGTALNRFYPNTSLQPETVWSGEVGLGWLYRTVSVEGTLFVQRTADAIDQRTVEVAGRQLRQRVNLEGSVVYGGEVAGAWSGAAGMRLQGHLTMLRAQGVEKGHKVPLAEKPALVAFLLAEAPVFSTLRASVDVSRIAGAYATERDGQRQRLQSGWLLGTRLSYRLPVHTASATAFVRVDNAMDATVLPQEGLPAPGRILLAGFTIQL